MNIAAESYGHAVILNLKGDLTEDSLPTLREAVDHHLAGAEVVDLVINLEGVPFMDSMGLEYLLDLQDLLAERFGRVRLAKADENIMTILEMTRLRPSFEIFHDIPEAVKAIQP